MVFKSKGSSTAEGVCPIFVCNECLSGQQCSDQVICAIIGYNHCVTGRVWYEMLLFANEHSLNSSFQLYQHQTEMR